VLENIAYLGLGFATVFLALEAAWHFTACKIHDKSTRILMVDNEPDANAALLGALEQSGFEADSNEYPPIALENFESHL
jgi:hypothetical protein